MLSDRIQEEVERRQARAQAAAAKRAAADAIIRPAFELLYANLAQTVSDIVGVHGLLSMATTATAIAVATRTFNVLNVDEIELTSTLNTQPETLRLVPNLSFVSRGEFGRIRVETTGVPEVSLRHRPELLAVMTEGLLMKGLESPRLVVLQGRTTQDLSADLLEDFLAAVLIRGAEL